MADYTGLIDALLGAHKQRTADIDYKEAAKRRLFGQNLDILHQALGKNMQNSDIRMADNGMAQSGISLNNLTEINKANNQQVGQLQMGLNNDIGQFEQDRAKSLADYELGRSGYLQQQTNDTAQADSAAQNEYAQRALAYEAAVKAAATPAVQAPKKVYKPNPVRPPVINPTTVARRTIAGLPGLVAT